MDNSQERTFSVGDLAKRVGVTVRTLQYYDKIGLLKAHFSPSGRRIYTSVDVLRLHQILFLKTFGFPLEEIGDKILRQNSSADLEQIFTRQRDVVLEQVESLNQMVTLLDSVIGEVKAGQGLSLKKLLTIMEVMKQGIPYSFVLRYFGDEQLQAVARRFNSPDSVGEYLSHAQDIFSRLETLYRQGVDPAGKEGQELAADWWNMVNEFTSDDPKLLKTLISAGMDIDHWPEETKPFKESIQNFLTKALYAYFYNRGIQLPDMEENKNE